MTGSPCLNNLIVPLIVMVPVGPLAEFIELCNIFIWGAFSHLAILQVNKGVFCLGCVGEGSDELLECIIPEEFIIIRVCGCNKIAIVINVSHNASCPRYQLAAEPSP
jgi:hypothetical protein